MDKDAHKNSKAHFTLTVRHKDKSILSESTFPNFKYHIEICKVQS